MPHATPATFVLDPAAALALCADRLGALTPEPQEAGPVRAFSVLDQIDRPLLAAGLMLIETSAGLTIFGADGQMHHAGGPGRGRLPGGLPEGPVRDRLSQLSPLRILLAQDEGTVRHLVLAWRDADGKARCRARLTLLHSDAGAGLGLIQVLGMRGYDRARADLAAHLAEAGAVPFSADGVLARLFPSHPIPALRPEAAVHPDQRAFDVAFDLVARHLSVARDREAGILEDLDTEFLHDYRVALRRIRSVLGLFRGVFGVETTLDLKARFAALMAATGPLRDLDVFLLDRESSYALVPPVLHAGLDAKFALIARQRAGARARLARHLRSEAHARQMTTLTALFADRSALDPGPRADEPVARYAGDLIGRRYRRLCASAAALDAASDDAEVHALRIDGKKLRYLIEFFAPLFPREDLRRVVRPLKGLQDSLGVINDCAVQQAALQDLLRGTRRKGPGPGLDVAQSVGALTAVLHQRQMAERRTALERLATFADPQMRRRVRALLQGLEGKTS